MSEPEEIFASALETLYDEVPVTVATSNGVYTHERQGQESVTIRIPRTDARNWGLQADGVWQAAVYLADNLPRPLGGKRVLELGAAAGLPGIVGAFGARDDMPERVVLSDYPDEGILSQLRENVAANRGKSRVRVDVVGHAWGTECGLGGERFDIIMAADVLWMEEMHEAFYRALCPGGRVHIVAGFHTGRGVIGSFLATAARHGLDAVEVFEVRIGRGTRREFRVDVPGEGMDERRGWLDDELEVQRVLGAMPALPFPATLGVGSVVMGWGSGPDGDIAIDPMLLKIGSCVGVGEVMGDVVVEEWTGGCAADDHCLPPTPPLSLGNKKRRRRPRLLVETECSFCQGDDQSNKHGVPENMASCAVCGRSGHPSCIQIPHLADVIRSYDWRCQDCKECEICQSKGDDSKMLFCDHCDRGWHFDCLTPPLGRAPRGIWACPMCTKAKPVASTSEPKPQSKARRKSHLEPSPVLHKSKRSVPFPVLTPETDAQSVDAEPSPEPSATTPLASPAEEPLHPSPHLLRLKRHTTTRRSASSSPTRPFKVRIRVTSKSDNEANTSKPNLEDSSEATNDPFGGFLSPQEADTRKTAIGPQDKERFEASRASAETRIHKLTATGSHFATPHTPRLTGSSSTYQLPGYVPPTRSLRSLPLRAGSPPPTTPTISTPGGIPPPPTTGNSGLRIRTIRFGHFDIDTWYDAPFPEEFSNIPEGRLWMCEFCLKYMRSGFQAGRHKMKCKVRCPPGDEIYRDGAISVFEVDGRKNKVSSLPATSF
ncbi:Histone acetyltransferase [Ceratobasidium theobromae]|uniref:Histone acetyltransferase n=1 Tax=Ceratobasidium theobromae TaxID=1582974 RepID=A0A5N5QLH8_9AGAM|nr:Histone acetyltransferase [Ceratobasidium theobromae]